MILVTGGAGFIGSVLVSELNKLGEENIVIVDRLKDSIKWLNLRGLSYREYINADELFSGDYDDLIAETDIIYHMGACSSTTELDMDYLMKNNFQYTKALFHFATTKNIPIIYASSAATYGAGEHGYADDDMALLKKLRPLNPYGYSKHLLDLWVTDSETPKPDHWFGLKFFNVFGPNEYHKKEMRSLVHKSYHQIKSTGLVKLFKSHKEGFKDGEQLRDFIYVKDVVRVMIELSYSDKGVYSGIYNLGTGKARSFKDLTLATFNALQLKENIEYIDMPEYLRAQYQYFTESSPLKLKKVLPHFRFTPLEEAVFDYVQNYLAHGDRFYGEI